MGMQLMRTVRLLADVTLLPIDSLLERADWEVKVGRAQRALEDADPDLKHGKPFPESGSESGRVENGGNRLFTLRPAAGLTAAALGLEKAWDRTAREPPEFPGYNEDEDEALYRKGCNIGGNVGDFGNGDNGMGWLDDLVDTPQEELSEVEKVA